MSAYRNGPNNFAFNEESRSQVARNVHRVNGSAEVGGEPVDFVRSQAGIKWIGFKDWKGEERRPPLNF